METVSTKIDEYTKREIERLVERGEFNSKSEVLRVALVGFLRRRQLKWRSRDEMRTYFEGRSKVPSGEVIEMIREEDNEL